MTIALIAINLLVFLFESSLGTLHPQCASSNTTGWCPTISISSIVTSMFLHGGWLHVLGNMWFLWIFGDNIEDLSGARQVSGVLSALRIVAALGQVIADPYSTVPMVGASGAIAGVMGAYMIKFPRARMLTLVFILFFITTIEIPAPIMLAYWFVIQLFSGFGSHRAHAHFRRAARLFSRIWPDSSPACVLVKVMGTSDAYNRQRDHYWE